MLSRSSREGKRAFDLLLLIIRPGRVTVLNLYNCTLIPTVVTAVSEVTKHRESTKLWIEKYRRRSERSKIAGYSRRVGAWTRGCPGARVPGSPGRGLLVWVEGTLAATWHSARSMPGSQQSRCTARHPAAPRRPRPCRRPAMDAWNFHYNLDFNLLKVSTTKSLS